MDTTGIPARVRLPSGTDLELMVSSSTFFGRDGSVHELGEDGAWHPVIPAGPVITDIPGAD